MGRYSSYSGYNDYPAYVSAAEKQTRNKKAVRQLQANGAALKPVVILGRTIATSWWGQSWNKNLERYADYSNRIGRGRSYVRQGAVLDLQIAPGSVKALVQGSRPTPYTVTLTIAKLGDDVWAKLRSEGMKCLGSLPELLAGKFPQALKDVFFAQDTGLFPSPKEIKLNCSCPDWASMCKHVAAVLYGIGNRLDQSPELLFSLRQVTLAELIANTVTATSQNLLDRGGQATGSDVLADADLEGIFGIELGDISTPSVTLPPVKLQKSQTASRKPKPATATPVKPVLSTSSAKPNKSITLAKSPKQTAAKSPKQTAAKSPKQAKPATSPKSSEAAIPAGRALKVSAKAPRHGTMIDDLVKATPGSRSFTAASLAASLPKWTQQQIANTLYRAVAQGRLDAVRTGEYRRRKSK